MCQPTYRLSNAIAPEGPCTGASADCPGLNGRARRPEVFRFRAVAHVRGIPADPADPIWSCTPAARSGRPDRTSLAPGTRARAGPARPPGPLASRPGQRPELLRFADCGQAPRRLRPAGRRCGRPGWARPRPGGAAPGPRPPPGRATARQCPDHGRPTRSSRTPDFRGVIARLLSIRGLQRIAAIHGTRYQATAVSGRRPIRMKTAWPRHVLPSPGITGTPRAPRIGRVRPRARAARAPSARCRPARAGPPAPRPRRVPGRAGRPGRRGP